MNPENVVIKKDVTIGPNSCIGTQGVTGPRYFIVVGRKVLVKSRGKLIINENVKIGALNSINLGYFKDNATVIEKNVVTGSLVVIGHDTFIGESSVLSGDVTLAGHVTVGKSCRFGVGSKIRNRVKIGDKAIISMGAVVTQDVPPGKRVTGNFAIDHDIFIQNLKKSLNKPL